jgi:hypothetical protein
MHHTTIRNQLVSHLEHLEIFYKNAYLPIMKSGFDRYRRMNRLGVAK